MLAISDRGLFFLSEQHGLGQASFEEEFRRVWGKYFPYILLGAVTFMLFVLLRRLR